MSEWNFGKMKFEGEMLKMSIEITLM